MANAYFAADYNNNAPQMQQFTPVVRPFNAEVNATAGASYGTQGQAVISTLGLGDTIQLCTLPGQGSGIVLLDYYIEFGKLDTGGGSISLVFELGLKLLALDPNQTSIAAAGYFATLITPSNVTRTVLRPDSYLSNAATPVLLPVTFPAAPILPVSISNAAPTPNAGLYDLTLQVTTAANTVSPTAAFISGWVKYAQISQAWAN